MWELYEVEKKEPKEVKNKKVVFRIKSDLLDTFRAKCLADGVSQTDVLTEAVIEFLKS